MQRPAWISAWQQFSAPDGRKVSRIPGNVSSVPGYAVTPPVTPGYARLRPTLLAGSCVPWLVRADKRQQLFH